jgi:anaerobic selenocysteine-containing dehydrogenase
MTRTLTTVAAAAVLASASAFMVPSQADARCFGCAVGVGVLGGVVAGAIVGSAIANSQAPAYYAPAPGYVAYPGYAAAAPVGCPGGYWGRQPLAYDAYGNPIRWSRPRFFCPPG